MCWWQRGWFSESISTSPSGPVRWATNSPAELRRTGAPREVVEQDGPEDDTAKHDLLQVALDVHQVHPVLDDRSDQRADQGSKHTAFAAGETRASDDNGRDDIQLIGFA